MSSDMTQLRCQEICLADSKCIGIVYSHHDDIFMEYCYACSNEPHPNFAQSPFGFYRRCDESVCTLPSFDGTGIVGLNEEVGCVSGDSLQDGSSCFTKCDNGYESSDGSNFKEITCTSGDISPLQTCIGTICTLPSFDGTGIVGFNEEVGCVSGDSLQDGGSCFTKCDNGYESSDGSNFKEITCTSGDISPLQTCIGTICTLPSFD